MVVFVWNIRLCRNILEESRRDDINKIRKLNIKFFFFRYYACYLVLYFCLIVFEGGGHFANLWNHFLGSLLFGFCFCFCPFSARLFPEEAIRRSFMSFSVNCFDIR